MEASISEAGTWLLSQEVELLGHRFHPMEVEVYLRCPGHDDPYVHPHPFRDVAGRWYLHRVGDGFRGGSFKGLDFVVSMGGGTAGLLIRSLRSGERWVNGPSLVVDHLLSELGLSQPIHLHQALHSERGPEPWQFRPQLHVRKVFASPRVGLRPHLHHQGLWYWIRNYRFTTAPWLRKGVAHTILGLYTQGLPIREVSVITKTRVGRVRQLIESFEAGRSTTVVEKVEASQAGWARQFGAAWTVAG